MWPVELFYITQPSNFILSQLNPLHILKPSIVYSVSIQNSVLCPGIQMGFFLHDLKVSYHFSIAELRSVSPYSLIFLELLTQSYSVKRTKHNETPHLPSSQRHHHCCHYLSKLFTHTPGTVWLFVTNLNISVS